MTGSDKRKRALITGITGQDGAYLAEFLLSKGADPGRAGPEGRTPLFLAISGNASAETVSYLLDAVHLVAREGWRLLPEYAFDADTGELLGAHMIGAEVTELIQGYAVAKTLETTEQELMQTVFPHPTLSEMMHESVLDAYGRTLHF